MFSLIIGILILIAFLSWYDVEHFYGSSVNLKPNYRDFKNFAAYTPFPINDYPDNCQMDFNCSNYPYDSNDMHASVCRRCTDGVNSLRLHRATHVQGRSVGRPREVVRLC